VGENMARAAGRRPDAPKKANKKGKREKSPIDFEAGKAHDEVD